jgi:hypothetical protein
MELNTQNENNQWGHTKKSLPYQQEYDLLGLILQASNDSQSGNGVEPFKESPEAGPQDLVSTCSVHSTILSNAEVLPAQRGELKHMPMDRYRAEGPAERYSLFDIGPSDDDGQWARYSSCICEK